LLPDDDDHRCAWRDEAESLRAQLDELRQQLTAFERRVLGPKSEKMPPMSKEVER